MLKLGRTTQFKRDFKREKAGQHADVEDALKTVILLLVNEKPLPIAARSHPLRGRWKGYHDCHVKPDLVLIYRKTLTAIELVRLGSHSELFG
jgi:mRNA interferase YafQ